MDRKHKKISKLFRLDDKPKQSHTDDVKDRMSKRNACLILEFSHVSPFKWLKNGFLCFFCGTKYTDPKVLREHTKNDHIEEKIMSAINRIKKHDLVKIDITRIDCKLCSEPIDNVESLKTHLQSVHKKPINNKFDDGIIPFKFDMDDYYCHICQSQFNVFITLNNHMNTHYQNYICETCGKAFATGKRLQSHSLLHITGEFPCLHCDKVFSLRSMRTNHTLRFHKEARKFKCPQCGDTFNSYLERNKHRRLVHNVTSLEYKCPMCPKVFALSGKRTYHIKQVHIKEKNHACTLCEWKFFSKTELQEHMIRHNGERIHQCQVCEKAYARKQTLREHMRIHNNDRRFVCSVCGQAFVQNCSRKYHMKVHHPDVGKI